MLSLVDDILKKYGKEMTWDIKAGLMGQRKRSHFTVVFVRMEAIIISP